MAMVTTVTAERSVVIFCKSYCCMSLAIKRLIGGFGVHPAVFELDEHPNGQQTENELKKLGCMPSVPALFVGQQLIGGPKEIISLHLNGELAPLVMNAST